MPLAGTNLSKTALRYQGVIIWNKILSVNINPDRSEQPLTVMLKNASTSNWYKFNSSGIYWYNFIVIITIIIIIQFKFISSVNVCTLFPVHLHSLHWLFLIRNIREQQLWNPYTFWGFLSPFAVFAFVCCAFMTICFSGWSLYWGPGVAVLTALSSLATWGCHD